MTQYPEPVEMKLQMICMKWPSGVWKINQDVFIAEDTNLPS